MKHLWTPGLIIAVLFVNVWIVSEGRFTRWRTRTAYYSLLADGFLRGQTNLCIDPDPRILATPDPYDPHYNTAFRLYDAALYNGKYYIYWGPVPALLLAPARVLARGDDHPIGDQYVMFAFTFGLLLISSALIFRIRRRLFPEQPRWPAACGLLIAGLANPMPFLLAGASIYPAAIVSGQFFLLAGIYTAWISVEASPLRSSRWYLFATGTCWSLAVGCRISLIPAVAALTGLVVLRIWSRKGAERRRELLPIRSAVAAGTCLMLPLAAGSLLFGAYNMVRFGSPFEFGTRYVLAGQNMHAMVANGRFASLRYIPINLVRYLFEVPALTPLFPYIGPYGDRIWGLLGIVVGKDYIIDCVAGMIWAAPVLGMAAVPIWIGLRRTADQTFSLQETRLRSSVREDRDTGWLILVLFTASALGILPSLAVAASTMRYLADATPSLAILASMGIWMQLRDHRGELRRARLVRAIAMLTGYSAAMGVLLAVASIYHRSSITH